MNDTDLLVAAKLASIRLTEILERVVVYSEEYRAANAIKDKNFVSLPSDFQESVTQFAKSEAGLSTLNAKILKTLAIARRGDPYVLCGVSHKSATHAGLAFLKALLQGHASVSPPESWPERDTILNHLRALKLTDIGQRPAG